MESAEAEVIMSEEIPWPVAGQRLFQGPSRATYITGLQRISHGFHDAGYVLVEHLKMQGRDDGLTRPVLYPYRHYLALALKEFICMVHWCEGDRYEPAFDHNLDRLWGEFYALVYGRLRDKGEEAIAELLAVGDIVKEMHAFDPWGTNARYSVGEASKQFSSSPYDLQVTMLGVRNWFHGTYDWWNGGNGPF